MYQNEEGGAPYGEEYDPEGEAEDLYGEEEPHDDREGSGGSEYGDENAAQANYSYQDPV